MAQDRDGDDYARAEYRERYGRDGGRDDDYGHQRAIDDERRNGHHRERPADEPYDRRRDDRGYRDAPRDDHVGASRREHLDNSARGQLKSSVERIERLEEEKKTIADDIKEVYGEAKG